MTTRFNRTLLTVAAITLLACALLALLRWNIPDDNRDAVMVLVGAIVMLAKEASGFLFGSSHGSEQKTEMMNQTQQVEVTNDPAHPVPVDQGE